jgi:leucyl-tRNA synthetase
MSRDQGERFLRALAPFAPHVCEELWARMQTGGLIVKAAWPAADPKYLALDEIDLPVQVNGKLRATVKAPKDSSQADLEAIARAAVASHLEGKQIVKTIVPQGRLVNFVVR